MAARSCAASRRRSPAARRRATARRDLAAVQPGRTAAEPLAFPADGAPAARGSAVRGGGVAADDGVGAVVDASLPAELAAVQPLRRAAQPRRPARCGRRRRRLARRRRRRPAASAAPSTGSPTAPRLRAASRAAGGAHARGRRRGGHLEEYGSTVPLTSVPLVVEWPYSGSPCVVRRRRRTRRDHVGHARRRRRADAADRIARAAFSNDGSAVAGRAGARGGASRPSRS